jgi:hypothetical protein
VEDVFFSNDPWPEGGSGGDNEVHTTCSTGHDHCCCSTYKASYWMKCRSYTHILSVNWRVMLAFQPDIVLGGFQQTSYGIPFMTVTVTNRTTVRDYPRCYYLNSSILLRKTGRLWLWFIFSAGFNGIKGAVKHQSVTKKMDRRGLYCPEGHCYLQYSQLYSAAFEITNWNDNVFTTLFWFTHDVDELISAEDTQSGSNMWVVWVTTMPRWPSGSIR